ncbi:MULTISPECIES: hypothetical protein [unclassified Mesorhizobium]|uniref:hypothetical protein n=1 Tax=unclassified Mesorhizobium TaxID=325217 RepID=UPI000FE4F6F7|nr:MULTISPECIES: hypothetical protein [unclassified Mesorhizobium]RWB92865.1 MAG: hypothetical protein EOQ57_35585 [Mesorhizobium sp.]TGV22174.1 hypothetical protein EN786_31115 [Mesorhizobium sp. M4B.F.Ca.ET.143.01.1.1]
MITARPGQCHAWFSAWRKDALNVVRGVKVSGRAVVLRLLMRRPPAIDHVKHDIATPPEEIF